MPQYKPQWNCIWPIIHIWGCNPSAACSPHQLHHSDCLYPHICHRDTSPCTSNSVSAASGVVQGEHLQKPTLLGPVESQLDWKLPTEGKREMRTKTGYRFKCINSFGFVLTPPKMDQLSIPSPGPEANTVCHCYPFSSSDLLWLLLLAASSHPLLCGPRICSEPSSRL